MAMANHDIALLDALYTLASGVPPDSEELARLQAQMRAGGMEPETQESE